MKKLKALVVLEKIINISDYGRYMEELETIKEAIKELKEIDRNCEGCIYNSIHNEQCIFCSRKCVDFYEAKGE